MAAPVKSAVAADAEMGAGTVTFHCRYGVGVGLGIAGWCHNCLTLPIDDEIRTGLEQAGWGPIENYEPLRIRDWNDPPKPLYCPAHMTLRWLNERLQ